MPAGDAGSLQREARKRGANPKRRRGLFDPVSRDQWLAVERFDCFNLKDYALRKSKGSMSNANRFVEMKRIIGICVLLIVPSLAHSQAKQLVDIAVTCKESIGNSFVFQFKEAIRSSASYTLTPGDSAPKATIFVDIVCVDVSDASEPATAVSVIAYTFRLNKNKGTTCSYLTNVLFYHGVRYMTHRFTKESAIGMLADLDEQNSKQP
jgi:hypothetical protein